MNSRMARCLLQAAPHNARIQVARPRWRASLTLLIIYPVHNDLLTALLLALRQEVVVMRNQKKFPVKSHITPETMFISETERRIVKRMVSVEILNERRSRITLMLAYSLYLTFAVPLTLYWPPFSGIFVITDGIAAILPCRF